MVLTRRAYKSIIRWLPNEVLGEIMTRVSNRELVALCQTSRLMNDIATPLLYRTVCFTALSPIQIFLSTAKKHLGSAQSRSRHLRQFSIVNPKLEMSLDLIADMISVLLDACHLRLLELIANITPPELPRTAYFPNLTTFRYFVYPQIFEFLNSHSTITTLTLFRRGGDRIECPTIPILLPKLVDYLGPGAIVPLLVCKNRTVVAMCVHWYADDEDVRTMLEALARMASSKHGLIITSDTLDEVSFIGSVSTSLPHTSILSLRRISTVSGYISYQYALAIAEHLRKFTALAVLELHAFEADEDEHVDLDFQIVYAWGAACKTLGEVKLHGETWKRMKAEWYCV